EYIAAGGDFADINCEGIEGTPSIGAVCFEVKGGDHLKLTIADDVSAAPVGVYAYRSDPNDVIDDNVVEFCGTFTDQVPDDAILVVVYLSQATAPLGGCQGEPATTGVVTAVIS
ncbi:MAG: hypothetical protein ACRD2A_25745, partial [Vicinamibacterales bacterium]